MTSPARQAKSSSRRKVNHKTTKKGQRTTKRGTKKQKEARKKVHKTAIDYSGLKRALDQLNTQIHVADRVAADPIRFPKRFSLLQDQEVVSLFSALLAYGRVSAIGDAIEGVLRCMGDHPAESAMTDALKWRTQRTPPTRFTGFVYRFTRGTDLNKLWLGVGGILLDDQCLGNVLRASLNKDDATLMRAYQSLHDQLLQTSAGLEGGRGFSHLLSDPRRGSALKRVNMWLRWLVRGPDDVDLGLWRDLGPERLILPLDVHTFRLSGALGLTTRRSADLKAAVEITEHLRLLKPADPIEYDFALAHLGISGACKGRRVVNVCEQCPLDAMCTLS